MNTVKTTALLLAALWLTAHGAAAEPAAQPASASLVLTFKGLRSPTGQVMGAVFDSEAAYGGGAPVRGLALKVNRDEVSVTLSGLKPGRYAVRAFHDLDGDGKLSMNPFGRPTEPVAFSNDAQGVMGAASWKDAAFEVGPGGAVQVVTIN